MEISLIVRSAAELNAAVKAVILGIDGAITEAQTENGGRATVHPPGDLVIKGMMITSLNAATVEETDTQPAATITTTDNIGTVTDTTTETPANSTTTETIGTVTDTTTETPANSTTTETIGESNERTLQTPPARTTVRGESGGDSSSTDTTHEEL